MTLGAIRLCGCIVGCMCAVLLCCIAMLNLFLYVNMFTRQLLNVEDPGKMVIGCAVLALPGVSRNEGKSSRSTPHFMSIIGKRTLGNNSSQPRKFLPMIGDTQSGQRHDLGRREPVPSAPVIHGAWGRRSPADGRLRHGLGKCAVLKTGAGAGLATAPDYQVK